MIFETSYFVYLDVCRNSIASSACVLPPRMGTVLDAVPVAAGVELASILFTSWSSYLTVQLISTIDSTSLSCCSSTFLRFVSL